MRRGRFTRSPTRPPQPARERAVGLLARRDFTTEELRHRLLNLGYEAAEAEKVIGELVEERILDDERFAHSYVARHAERGQGPVRIAADLRSMGLSAELIDRVLRSGLDWHSLAVQVRKAKFGLAVPTAWSQKARQARFLQYRGFSADHIRSALGADLDLD